MRRAHEKKKLWQRGSSLVEFVFVAPIILVSGGATVDVARFAQTQQVTSFISQETSSLIYRECLDQTVLPAAVQNTAVAQQSLPISRNGTIGAINGCIQRIQSGQQGMLTTGAPGAVLLSTGFRMLGNSLSANCGEQGVSLATMAVPASVSSGTETAPITQPVQRGGPNYNPNTIEDDSYLNWQEGMARQVWQEHPALLTSKVRTSGNEVKLTRATGDITIVDGNTACAKNRFVVVEVTFAFTPFVKFLPNFITGWSINQDGVLRETTVL